MGLAVGAGEVILVLAPSNPVVRASFAVVAFNCCRVWAVRRPRPVVSASSAALCKHEAMPKSRKTMLTELANCLGNRKLWLVKITFRTG